MQDAHRATGIAYSTVHKLVNGASASQSTLVLLARWSRRNPAASAAGVFISLDALVCRRPGPCLGGRMSAPDDAGGHEADGLALCGRCDGSGLVPASAVRARDDAADAFDVLVRLVWEAVTGNTHEGPASVDVLLEAVAGLRARADAAHLLAVRVVQATELHDDLAAVDATPESALGMVRELRAELTFSRGERGAVEDLARRMEARALRAETRAEKAEAARDALRTAVQKYRDAVDACHILEDDARDVSLQARLMREAVADGWTPEMVRAHRESDLSRARCAVGDARADLDAALAGEG